MYSNKFIDISSIYTYNTVVLVQAVLNISRTNGLVHTKWYERVCQLDDRNQPRCQSCMSMPPFQELAVFLWWKLSWFGLWCSWSQELSGAYRCRRCWFPIDYKRRSGFQTLKFGVLSWHASSSEARSFLRRQEWNIPPMPRWKWQA